MSKKNVTIIESPTQLVLFSYSTPVVFFDKVQDRIFQTSEKHSKTTTTHIKEFYQRYIIGQYRSAFNPEYVEQSELDARFPISVTRF